MLPRKSVFVRSDADLTRLNTVAGAVVLAANLDLVLVVTAAFQDLNIRRLERYLAAAWDSGAQPVVILTKTDLVEDAPELVRLIEAAAPRTPVLAVSNLTGEGLEQVRALILLEDGGLVLDTPGMRLFSPADDAGLEAAFADIETLARACRFTDCTHRKEPGCAVQAAVQAGVLEPDRLSGWEKLRRELSFVERKDDKGAQSEQSKRWRGIHKAARSWGKQKRSGLD